MYFVIYLFAENPMAVGRAGETAGTRRSNEHAYVEVSVQFISILCCCRRQYLAYLLILGAS